MVESQLNPEEGKKRGGEVKMAGGGEMDFFMEAIAPNRESKSDPRAEAAGVIGKSVAKSMVSPLIGIYESIKSGKYGYTGSELQAVNNVLAEHQEIMGRYTKVEVKRMMAQIEANERRGNFYTAATRVVREHRV